MATYDDSDQGNFFLNWNDEPVVVQFSTRQRHHRLRHQPSVLQEQQVPHQINTSSRFGPHCPTTTPQSLDLVVLDQKAMRFTARVNSDNYAGVVLTIPIKSTENMQIFDQASFIRESLKGFGLKHENTVRYQSITAQRKY